MSWKLSRAAVQLREQIDDCYPERSRKSDGVLGDARHSARKSDHNPDDKGWVRAIDITATLGDNLDMFCHTIHLMRIVVLYMPQHIQNKL